VKGDRVFRRYDRLTAEERFRLVVAAMGRRDTTDCDQLWQTSPRSTYRMPDATFTDRFDAAERVVLAVLMAVAPLTAKIELLRALRLLFATAVEWTVDESGFAAFYESTVNQHDRVPEAVLESDDRPRERLPDLIDRIESELTAHATALAHGLAGFCREELNLEPLDLIRAFAIPLLSDWEMLLELPAEADGAARYQRFLVGSWRWRLGLQPEPPDLEP
jgi:hypothetical protein